MTVASIFHTFRFNNQDPETLELLEKLKAHENVEKVEFCKDEGEILGLITLQDKVTSKTFQEEYLPGAVIYRIPRSPHILRLRIETLNEK